MDLDLPPLSDEPERYADFCLSLSTPLIHTLTSVLTKAASKAESRSNLVLSVGSGSGLLEAHLLSYWSSTAACDLLIHGVEVHTGDSAHPVNRYLPEQNCSTVKATWQLAPDLHVAGALLLVYPRDTDLVSRYLQAIQDQENSPLQVVIWLGPRADYHTFAGCLQDHSGFGPVEVVENGGLADYEMMAIIQRQTI